MFSRVKRWVGRGRAGRVAGRRASATEALEGRQYLFAAPDVSASGIAEAGLQPAVHAAVESAPGIQQLALVNADNGQLVGPFENNTTVNYAALPANLSVRAFIAGTAGSVRFAIDGSDVQTENYDPYNLLGENAAGLPNAWRPTNGTHTMRVTAFSGQNGAGAQGATMELTFHVGNAPTPPPSVVPGAIVSFTDTVANASEEGLSKGIWAISRTGSTASDLTVYYNVAGSATNGVDYETLTGAITIPAGQSSVELAITPREDSIPEGTENVTVNLIAGSNYTVGSPAPLTCPIFDNDAVSSPPPGGAVVTFSDNTADVGEQNLNAGTLAISRTGSTASALIVYYNVAGSATNGVDYEVLTGAITIPAGKLSASLVITPKEDSLVEGTENVLLTLIPGAGYALGSTLNADIAIVDNDANPGPSQGISDITWTSSNVARSPIPRTEGGSIQVGSKIYAVGGFTAEGGTGSFFPLTRRVDVYDMASKTWKQLASLPSQAAGNHAGIASDGQYIYAVAGQIEDTFGKGTSTAWRYNIAANTWTQFPSLPAIRFGGAAFFVADGWLHYVGGDTADRKTPTTDHWAINLSNTGAGWVRRASMPLPGDHMSHAVINGKVYLFGGEHGHQGLDPNIEGTYVQHNYTFEYNPANDTWTRKADMPLALSHIEGSTLVINGQAVLIGGLLTGGGNNTTNRVHVYDPVANAWKTLPARYPKRIIGGESGYLNGKIYMTDGYSPDSDDRQAGFEGTVKFA